MQENIIVHKLFLSYLFFESFGQDRIFLIEYTDTDGYFVRNS